MRNHITNHYVVSPSTMFIVYIAILNDGWNAFKCFQLHIKQNVILQTVWSIIVLLSLSINAKFLFYFYLLAINKYCVGQQNNKSRLILQWKDQQLQSNPMLFKNSIEAQFKNTGQRQNKIIVTKRRMAKLELMDSVLLR